MGAICDDCGRTSSIHSLMCDERENTKLREKVWEDITCSFLFLVEDPLGSFVKESQNQGTD